MTDSRLLHFIKELPAWVVMTPIIIMFVIINYHSDRPVWERMMENSLTALFAFLSGRKSAQQTGTTETGDVNITPTETPLENLTPTEIDGAVEQFREEK